MPRKFGIDALRLVREAFHRGSARAERTRRWEVQGPKLCTL